MRFGIGTEVLIFEKSTLGWMPPWDDVAILHSCLTYSPKTGYGASRRLLKGRQHWRDSGRTFPAARGHRTVFLLGAPGAGMSVTKGGESFEYAWAPIMSAWGRASPSIPSAAA